MIEVLETGEPNKLMVYLSTDEAKRLSQLKNLKEPAGKYYDKTGAVIGYHWILNRITVGRLKLATE